MFGKRTNARRSRLTRSLAAVLGVVLLFGSLVPPFALAEGDREGVGAAPPGPILGHGPEPGGEETSLEEVPIAPGEEASEEIIPAAPEETEPIPPTAPPPPAVATEPLPETQEVAPPPASTEPAPAPLPAVPAYGTEEPVPPSYEPEPPNAVPVENEAIVAPGDSDVAAEHNHSRPSRPGSSTATVPAPEAPPAEEPAPAPVETPEPALSVAPSSGDRSGSLPGTASYTVVEGDCLWVIAERVLPAGATFAEIEAEISRLWRLNASRIGTGDPNLILVGTILRIH